MGDLAEVCRYRAISSDIEVEDDFHKLINAIINCKDFKNILWIGSAGLAEHLVKYVVISSGFRGPALICLGSANNLLRKQVNMLIKMCSTALIPLNVKRLVKNYDEEFREALNKVLMSYDRRPLSIILATALHNNQIRHGEELMEELNIDRISLGEIVADSLGRMCAMLINEVGVSRLGGLILSGGDTALAVLRHLGFEVLEVVGEVEPGLPLLKVVGADVKLVTKAGGFGDEWTLIRATYRLIS